MDWSRRNVIYNHAKPLYSNERTYLCVSYKNQLINIQYDYQLPQNLITLKPTFTLFLYKITLEPTTVIFIYFFLENPGGPIGPPGLPMVAALM